MALRTRLEAGELDGHGVRRRLGELARALLRRHPRDAELLHVARGLIARGLVPPPPATLPSGDAREVRRALARRTPAELQALASALVMVPDVIDDAPGARAALELFVRVPGEATRAARLADLLEQAGHDVALARFELALAADDGEGAVARALEAVPEARRGEAARRAAAHALAKRRSEAGAALGVDWLVPIDDGARVVNAALAFARRPALRSELGPVAERLLARDAGIDAALAAAETIDAKAGGPEDWARATALYESALAGDDRLRFQAARAALLEGAGEPVAMPSAPTPLVHRLAARLARLARPGSDVAVPEAEDAAALELLGARAAAARLWSRRARASDELDALTHAVRLAGELDAEERAALSAHLRRPELEDEARLGDGAMRTRAALAHQLAPDPWTAVRLAASAPARMTNVAAESTGPARDEASTSPREGDPHHPLSRLAAAADLLASGSLEPASNILAALVRKVDEAEGETPARLFNVVAQALEAEEPPPDLVAACVKALHDARRTRPLLAALRRNTSAAFALHEPLVAFALDPSRADVDRLLAAEVWLAIWTATETSPDPDTIRTLREQEPALLIAAALRLGAQPDPLVQLARVLDDAEVMAEPETFSAALLSLALGRR